MGRRWIRLAACAYACAGFAAGANVELKISKPLSATLKEAVCLHESPDNESETIICLNAGAPLTLVARLKDKEVVDGQEGHWYKAEVKGGASGWVFSTFLDILPEGKAAAGGCDK